MKKRPEKRGRRNELRREYDLSKLKGGVRSKYTARYRAGTNLVLLSRDVAEYFLDEQSVNTALRNIPANFGARELFPEFPTIRPERRPSLPRTARCDEEQFGSLGRVSGI
jgi:hypothetical protein